MKLTLSENESNISQLLQYLQTLANTADNHLWTGIQNDYELYGATGGLNPKVVAADLSVAAEEVCNHILNHVADMTGETATKVNWAASKLSLWSPAVSLVTQRVSSIITDIMTIASDSPSGYIGQTDYDIRETLRGAMDTLYDQVEAALNNGIGPNFPSLRTTFWPELEDFSAVDGYPVTVAAEIPLAGDVLYLTLKNADGDTMKWNGNQAGWDALGVGDLVYLETLTVTGFSERAGNVYVVADVDDVTNQRLELTVLGATVLAEATETATSIGEVLRLQKIKAA